MNRILYLFKTGVKNVFAHRSSSMPLMLSMFILISVNLLLLTARNNVTSVLHLFDERASAEIILSKGVETGDVNRIIDRIRGIDSVDASSITYKDETRNLKEFMEADPDIALAMEMLEDNPLPPTITLQLSLTEKTLDNMPSLAADLSSMDEITEVIYPGGWLSALNRGMNLAGDVLAVVIASLLFVSWLLWLSIFKTSIYNLRDEIEIMEVVGGTRLYIRTPFYIETIFYTAISFFLSLFMISQLSVRITAYIPEFAFLNHTQIISSGALALLLALLGTEKAINRILK